MFARPHSRLSHSRFARSLVRSLVRLPGTQQTGLWRVLQRRRVAGGQRWVLNSTDVQSHAPVSLSLSLTRSLVLRASLARQAHSTGMAESGISGQDGRSLCSRGTLEGSLPSTFPATVGIDLDRRALARPPTPPPPRISLSLAPRAPLVRQVTRLPLAATTTPPGYLTYGRTSPSPCCWGTTSSCLRSVSTKRGRW